MKKVFLSLAVIAALTVVSCKNSENAEGAATDTTAVDSTATDTTATTSDSTATDSTKVDSTAAKTEAPAEKK